MINPKDKELDPDDPMELVGVEIPGGDAHQVLDDLVQEYLFMGWSSTRIMYLFRSPHYAATHHIYQQMGADYVKERIEQLSQQWSQGWINGGAGNA